VTLVPLPFDGPAYEVLIGAACVVAGVFARRVAAVRVDVVAADPVLAHS
jgi:hypothetical protein